MPEGDWLMLECPIGDRNGQDMDRIAGSIVLLVGRGWRGVSGRSGP